jgi:hypothetical protein
LRELEKSLLDVTLNYVIKNADRTVELPIIPPFVEQLHKLAARLGVETRTHEETSTLPKANSEMPTASVELDGTGEIIINTLCKHGITSEEVKWLGKKIATMARANYNSHFKGTLAGLKKRKLLENRGRGYFLSEAGQRLCPSRKSQDKVR